MNVAELIKLLQDFEKHDPHASLLIALGKFEGGIIAITGAVHEVDPDSLDGKRTGPGIIWVQTENH